MVSDWNVLPLDIVAWDEHVISDFDGLLFILLNDESQVLNLSLSNNGGSFGLLIPWRGLLLCLWLVDKQATSSPSLMIGQMTRRMRCSLRTESCCSKLVSFRLVVVNFLTQHFGNYWRTLTSMKRLSFEQRRCLGKR